VSFFGVIRREKKDRQHGAPGESEREVSERGGGEIELETSVSFKTRKKKSRGLHTGGRGCERGW